MKTGSSRETCAPSKWSKPPCGMLSSSANRSAHQFTICGMLPLSSGNACSILLKWVPMCLQMT
jgi:hypothetical protein